MSCETCRRMHWHFPFENGAIKMDAFAVEGRVVYEIWLWKHFWKQVDLGIAGLNPIKMFQGEYLHFQSEKEYVN